jgi:cytochrome o ubiquinol oxidase subunit 1
MGDGFAAAILRLCRRAHVEGTDPYCHAKQRAVDNAQKRDEPEYEPGERPRNSATGLVCAFFATIAGFALFSPIWWIVGLAFVGAWGTFIVFAWRDHQEELIPVETVARFDQMNRKARALRLDEMRVAA